MSRRSPAVTAGKEASKAIAAKLGAAEPIEASFAEVVDLIEQARQRVYQAVNTELVGLYWQIGKYIGDKLAAAEWGDSVVGRLAQHLSRTVPGLRGFSAQNLWRMRQFFETYREDQKLSALVRVLPWTHNLIILGQSKRPEEREFYLHMAIQEKWPSRELERQFRLGAFERTVLAPPKLSAALREFHGEAATGAFKDAYAVEFLNLPAEHSEDDLHRGLLGQLRAFLTELGRDFCFAGSEFPVQVGGRDFALDLLFFHRGLNCLVAVELKVDRFEPEHLGKLNPAARQADAGGQAARVLCLDRARICAGSEKAPTAEKAGRCELNVRHSVTGRRCDAPAGVLQSRSRKFGASCKPDALSQRPYTFPNNSQLLPLNFCSCSRSIG